MTKVSIVIPYFQKEAAILHRALRSVSKQSLAPETHVDVIVVDDGSPIPAMLESEGIAFKDPFRLAIISQRNQGVAQARNAGLEAVDGSSKYIAFLDSDDTWHEDHLREAIAALEEGHDLYFCDNRRPGVHDSNFHLGSGLILRHIQNASAPGIIPLAAQELATIVLRDCPAQMSSVVYRREVAPKLRFDTSMMRAGEDILFLMQLSCAIQIAAFSSRVLVECGRGVNLYFGNLDWDSEGHLRRVIDNLRAHVAIGRCVPLSAANARWNSRHIATLRKEVAFHAVRRLAKGKRGLPLDLAPLVAEDRWFGAWLPLYAVQTLIGRAVGLYHPH